MFGLADDNTGAERNILRHSRKVVSPANVSGGGFSPHIVSDFLCSRQVPE